MQKVYLLILTLLVSSWAFCQEMSIEYFKEKPEDLNYIVENPEFDQNGNVCALIRIITDKKGFYFDGGLTGIAKTVYRDGEIWLYIPPKSKRLTIIHDTYGVIRNFTYTSSIQESMVYELKLFTPEVDEELDNPNNGKYIITTNPTRASVFINYKKVGFTPYTLDTTLNFVFNYEIKAKNFVPINGSDTIVDNIKHQHFDLKSTHYEKRMFFAPGFYTSLGTSYSSFFLYGLSFGKLGGVGWYGTLKIALPFNGDDLPEPGTDFHGPLVEYHRKFAFIGGLNYQLTRDLFLFSGIGLKRQNIYINGNTDNSIFHDLGIELGFYSRIANKVILGLNTSLYTRSGEVEVKSPIALEPYYFVGGVDLGFSIGIQLD